jgi:hypothetical protein
MPSLFVFIICYKTNVNFSPFSVKFLSTKYTLVDFSTDSGFLLASDDVDLSCIGNESINSNLWIAVCLLDSQDASNLDSD